MFFFQTSMNLVAKKKKKKNRYPGQYLANQCSARHRKKSQHQPPSCLHSGLFAASMSTQLQVLSVYHPSPRSSPSQGQVVNDSVVFPLKGGCVSSRSRPCGLVCGRKAIRLSSKAAKTTSHPCRGEERWRRSHLWVSQAPQSTCPEQTLRDSNPSC